MLTCWEFGCCFRPLVKKVQAIVEKPLFSETVRQEQNMERFVANSVAGEVFSGCQE